MRINFIVRMFGSLIATALLVWTLVAHAWIFAAMNLAVLFGCLWAASGTIGLIVRLRMDQAQKLEPGGVYVIQVPPGITESVRNSLSEQLRSAADKFGVRFVVLGNGIHMVDAPITARGRL